MPLGRRRGWRLKGMRIHCILSFLSCLLNFQILNDYFQSLDCNGSLDVRMGIIAREGKVLKGEAIDISHLGINGQRR